MEHDELAKLAGEQALLKKEYTELSAVFNRDKEALLNLYSEINGGHGKTTWLEGGIALLQRLHNTQTELSDLYRRLNELGKLTGL